MKISSVSCISAIVASTLLTFSTAAFSISQPQNSSANSQLQPLQISNLSMQKNDVVSAKAEEAEEDKKEDGEEPTAGRCNPSHPLFPYCGWW